jgi:hypothetical protein
MLFVDVRPMVKMQIATRSNPIKVRERGMLRINVQHPKLKIKNMRESFLDL